MALKAAQRKAWAEHGPYESRLSQAAYVAQQPGPTQSQKDAYEQLSHEEEAELRPSTRHLMALKILIDVIQNDIDSQKIKLAMSRILVVDDDPTLLTLLKVGLALRSLQNAGAGRDARQVRLSQP